MFTGIVEELGEVVEVEPVADGSSARLSVRGPLVTADVRRGDSIAVDGVCLTVVDAVDGVFTADVMGETLRRTTLGAVRPKDPVNLERAARLGDRIGGHLVTGHVDGIGCIQERFRKEAWELVRIWIPDELARYTVEKGSISVDGVSLTVVSVGPSWFTVGLIPTTLAMTTLGHKQVGDRVNLEVDMVAKYVAKLVVQ